MSMAGDKVLVEVVMPRACHGSREPLWQQDEILERCRLISPGQRRHW